jgi:hypothetical protein
VTNRKPGPGRGNPLGRALAEHRRQHPDCDGCPGYLAIARAATAARQLYAGSTAPRTILSAREAQ